MGDEKTFAVVELQNQMFKLVLSQWIQHNDEEIKCKLPSTGDQLILKAIQEHRKPNATWVDHDIVKIHRYADDMQEAKSLLQYAKLGVPLQDQSFNSITTIGKKTRHERKKKQNSDCGIDMKVNTGKSKVDHSTEETKKRTLNTSSPVFSSKKAKKPKSSNLLNDTRDSDTRDTDIDLDKKDPIYDFDAMADTSMENESALDVSSSTSAMKTKSDKESNQTMPTKLVRTDSSGTKSTEAFPNISANDFDLEELSSIDSEHEGATKTTSDKESRPTISTKNVTTDFAETSGAKYTEASLKDSDTNFDLEGLLPIDSSDEDIEDVELLQQSKTKPGSALQNLQQQKEEGLKEQNKSEQKSKEENLKEQKKSEQKRKEEELKEQKRKEEDLKEQKKAEQKRKEDELKEQKRKEKELKEQKKAEQKRKEEELKEQKRKEKELKEQNKAEQKRKEEELKEQKRKEKELKEQNKAEQKRKEEELKRTNEQLKRKEKDALLVESDETPAPKKAAKGSDGESLASTSKETFKPGTQEYKLIRKTEKLLLDQSDSIELIEYIRDHLPNMKDKIKSHEVDDEDYEEYDEIFPIKSEAALQDLEERLKNTNERKKLRKYFGDVGANNPILLTNNILNKALDTDVAVLYSFKGKTKLNFSKLYLSQCIIRAVRSKFPDALITDITDKIGSWLAVRGSKKGAAQRDKE